MVAPFLRSEKSTGSVSPAIARHKFVGRCPHLYAISGGVQTRVNMRFEGTSAYVATDDLKVAVNAAITLERPLLVKGEPGTGKTVLALEIAKSLNAPLIEWHVKSTTKAMQ